MFSQLHTKYQGMDCMLTFHFIQSQEKKYVTHYRFYDETKMEIIDINSHAKLSP